MSPSPQPLSVPAPCLVLPIETKVRELHAKFFMGCIAAERGFSVLLGRSNTIQRRVAWLPRGAIFVDKSIDPRRAQRFRDYNNLGLRIATWCEEGLVFISEDEYVRRRVSSAALSRVEWFFAWGAYQAGILRRHVPEHAGRIVEAGNPRMDLLSPGMRWLFEKEAEEIARRYPRLILINTNYSLCNHRDGPGAFRAGLVNSGKIKSPEDERFLEGWINHKKVLFSAFVEMLPVLSRRFPDANIVVRPHPCENHDTWRKTAASLPNVAVACDGSVIPWLLAARAVIHNGCTTGVEGYLLGRHVIAYQPVKSDYDMYLPNCVSHCATTMPELVAATQLGLSGAPPYSSEEAQKAIATYLHAVDGSSSDQIVEHLWAHRAAPPSGRVASWVCGIRRQIRRLQTGDEVPSEYQKQKFSGLAISELQELLASCQSATGRFRNLVIQPLWNDCFVLRGGC